MKKIFVGIKKNVVVTGIVSFLTDVSTEMIYPILPLFLSQVLKASMVSIGLIEGVAESTASILKIFSGWLSDKMRRRKFLMVIGYGLSDLIKPLLYLVNSWTQVLGIRFLDRTGKGIRTSPRDALIADASPEEHRGKAFGFHRAMDTAGAAIGPLLAFAILAFFANRYRLVFLLSAIPGVLAIIILILFLKEKKKPLSYDETAPKISFRSLSREFKLFTIIATIFTLGNSSDAFLILRAKNLGLSIILIPIVYFLFNMVYSILSMPAGILSDKIGRKRVIILGFFIFALIYLGFALAKGVIWVWILFIFYGAYYALTEGVQRAFVADLVSKDLHGTAMGTFNFGVGISALPASIIGGALWNYVAPQATFYYGSALSLLAIVLFLIWFRK